MTESQLRAVMKYHLKSFNDEGVPISDTTLHSTILSDSDGFGTANSKAIYKSVIRWTLWKNDGIDPHWPVTWVDLNVLDLAHKLLSPA